MRNGYGVHNCRRSGLVEGFDMINQCYEYEAAHTIQDVLSCNGDLNIALVADSHLDNSVPATIENISAVDQAVRFDCCVHLGDFLAGEIGRRYAKLLLRQQLALFRPTVSSGRFFLIFQVISLKLRKLPFMRIVIGILYTYLGLVLFLTGVNVGFSPLGYALGAALAEGWKVYLLAPLAMLMGWFIINAEPAVHTLNKQVEELSAGAISAKAMGMSLSIAVSAAGGLAMLRVITGISIMYFLVPGYLIALALSFFVPRTFTAIAFDSGGVASGPLTATFMLPFATGACEALGGNVMTDAFGLVALVAMMPLITVQVMGAIYVVKSRHASQEPQLPDFGDNEIIELWEAC